jgi:hypothetical protein
MTNAHTQSNGLVNSLLAFHNTAENQEFFDYLSEHLYIQSQIAMPRMQQFGNIKGMDSFQQTCKKIYYAGDDNMKDQAVNELRVQMAV